MSEAPALVSQAPILAAGQQVVSREEKIEYRDQDGNLLDEEQVKALEGKVSFKTRYETRTRVVDAQGNEIQVVEGESDGAGVAPPHPDVEGVDSSTAGEAVGAGDAPKSAGNVQADESKEGKVQERSEAEAKPASEGNEATAA